MLEPLELERLAGTRAGGFDKPKVSLFVVIGRFDKDGNVSTFWGIFFTVFVETALLSEDLELLRLVLELLRSTSNLLLATDLIESFC